MTPDIVLEDISFENAPSKTYLEDFSSNRISGTVDGHGAMRQAIFKILNTERYQYPIYSWNYGIELEDLFGMPIPYVCTELERKIKEALEWDDRIDKVDSFIFDLSERNIVKVSFTAHTIFGDVEDNFKYNTETGNKRSRRLTRFEMLTGRQGNNIEMSFELDANGNLILTTDSRFTGTVDFDINSAGEVEGTVSDV